MADKTVITSKKFTLDWKDLIKGLVVSVLSAAITVIQISIDAGTLEFDWKKIATVSISAGLAYLAKNFFTPSEVKQPVQ